MRYRLKAATKRSSVANNCHPGPDRGSGRLRGVVDGAVAPGVAIVAGGASGAAAGVGLEKDIPELLATEHVDEKVGR